MIEWLYGEGENSTIDEYLNRYTKLRAEVDPVKERSIYHDEI